MNTFVSEMLILRDTCVSWAVFITSILRNIVLVLEWIYFPGGYIRCKFLLLEDVGCIYLKW